MKVRCIIFGHYVPPDRLSCKRCDKSDQEWKRNPPMWGFGVSYWSPIHLWYWFLRWWAKGYTPEGARYTFRLGLNGRWHKLRRNDEG